MRRPGGFPLPRIGVVPAGAGGRGVRCGLRPGRGGAPEGGASGLPCGFGPAPARLTGAGDLLQKTDYNYNMDNGILTAQEAQSLNLDRTDLVVLSACETGLGDIQAGEGVYGLQRAFLVAGAKVHIMSMFKVDDTATQKLMENFYSKWSTTNNMRQSFIDAKKELRLEYKEPIYWGAFMMIGLE